MLPKEAIKEYKEIYKRLYAVDLSDEEAGRRANNLIALYATVYGDNSERLANNNVNNN